MKSPDCLFCKIVDRKISASIVYETEETLGFKDVNPQAPVHFLFVPKKHIENIADAPASDSAVPHLVEGARIAAQTHKIDREGYRLVFNYLQNGGQTVNHLHLHLLGGRKMNWPPG